MSPLKPSLSIKLFLFVATTLLSNLHHTLAQQLTTARILLYTATADFRHDSIPTAIQALKNQSGNYDVEFDATEDGGTFTEEGLEGYDAVMWVSTTGEGAFEVDCCLVAVV